MSKIASRNKKDSNTSESGFEIDTILDKKWTRDGYRYLIRWEGYSDENNTWEPFSHIRNCRGLLQEFHQRMREKKEEEKKMKKEATELEVKKEAKSFVKKEAEKHITNANAEKKRKKIEKKGIKKEFNSQKRKFREDIESVESIEVYSVEMNDNQVKTLFKKDNPTSKNRRARKSTISNELVSYSISIDSSTSKNKSFELDDESCVKVSSLSHKQKTKVKAKRGRPRKDKSKIRDKSKPVRVNKHKKKRKRKEYDIGDQIILTDSEVPNLDYERMVFENIEGGITYHKLDPNALYEVVEDPMMDKLRKIRAERDAKEAIESNNEKKSKRSEKPSESKQSENPSESKESESVKDKQKNSIHSSKAQKPIDIKKSKNLLDSDQSINLPDYEQSLEQINSKQTENSLEPKIQDVSIKTQTNKLRKDSLNEQSKNRINKRISKKKMNYGIKDSFTFFSMRDIKKLKNQTFAYNSLEEQFSGIRKEYIEITDHYFMNGVLLLKIIDTSNDRQDTLGYFSSDLLKKFVPLQLARYYERFVEFATRKDIVN